MADDLPQGWSSAAPNALPPGWSAPTEVPHDHPAQTFRDYLSTSASQLGTGAREAWEGLKETGSDIAKGYAQGAQGAQTWAAKPLYGIGGALQAAAQSPAADLINNAALGSMGVELPPALPGGAAVRMGQDIPGSPGGAARAAAPVASSLEKEIGGLAQQAARAAPVEHLAAAPTMESDIAAVLKNRPGSVGAEAAGKQRLPGLLAKPEPVSQAEGSAGLIRQQIGVGARRAAQEAAAFEPQHAFDFNSYAAQVNRMPEASRLANIEYLENASKPGFRPNLPPEQLAIADRVRAVNQNVRRALEQSTPTENMNFVEDYYRHLWKDPAKADAFMHDWFGKEGSSSATKARTVPTIADGMKAGLIPKTSFVDVTLENAANMNRFVAMNEVVEIGKDAGYVRAFPQFGQPEGWVPLEGRHGTTFAVPTKSGGESAAMAMRFYADPKWAKDYNNFVSKGFEGGLGGALDKYRGVSNAVLGMKLGLSGFHAVAMTNEALVADAARAVDNIRWGQPFEAAKAAGRAATALGPAVGDVLRGRRGLDIYKGMRAGSETDNAIISALTEANFRFQTTPVERFSAEGDFWNAFKKGALGQQFANQGMMIRDAEGWRKLPESMKQMKNFVGRTMETLTHPLFEYYIPRLKTGAAMDLMGDFLKANPGASHDEIITAARKVSDSIDNRFGMMQQDNIMWNRKAKEAAQTAFLSYSWTLGTLRELHKGAFIDIPRAVAGKGWTHQASYVIGLTFATAYLNGVYQYLHTGNLPGQNVKQGTGNGYLDVMRDLYSPRTGGTIAATAFSPEKEERSLIPGYAKEIISLAEVVAGQRNLADIPIGKLQPLLKSAWGVITNKDWRNDPFRDANAKTEDQVRQVLGYVAKETLEPISIEQVFQLQPGTGRGMLEAFGGIRNAPGLLQDPQGTSNFVRYDAATKWITKLQHEQNDAAKMGDNKRVDVLADEIAQRKTEASRMMHDQRERSELGKIPRSKHFKPRYPTGYQSRNEDALP